MLASVFLPKQIIQAVGYPLTDIQMCSEGGIGFTADIKGTRVKFFKLDTCWLCNQFFPTMDALVIKYEEAIEDYIVSGKADELWLVMKHLNVKEGYFNVGIPSEMAIISDDEHTQECYRSMFVHNVQGAGRPYAMIKFMQDNPNNNFGIVSNIGWINGFLVIESNELPVMKVRHNDAYPIGSHEEALWVELGGDRYDFSFDEVVYTYLCNDYGINLSQDERAVSLRHNSKRLMPTAALLVDYTAKTIKLVTICESQNPTR